MEPGPKYSQGGLSSSFNIDLGRRGENHLFGTNALFFPTLLSGVPNKTFLNNSLTPKDIEMKFLKFNIKPMGVILLVVTSAIVFRCCHRNLLFLVCRQMQK